MRKNVNKNGKVEKRTEVIAFRVSKAQKAALKRKQKEAGLKSLARYAYTQTVNNI